MSAGIFWSQSGRELSEGLPDRKIQLDSARNFVESDLQDRVIQTGLKSDRSGERGTDITVLHGFDENE